MLGDLKTRFVIVHEQVGPFNRYEHKEVTYRDLAVWDVKGNYKDGFETDYSRPLIKETKANVDRLIALGAIKPLVLLGAH
jgi:hypothetical protein